ncbi:MAG: protein kinase [Deltaproteobacteria bacterium]|nr:protein kinase [Deltaproteobacteria bacterium]
MSSELDSNDSGPPPGEATRFPVIRCLGAGAKADTYLCRDTAQGNRPVIRKVLNAENSAENPDIVDAVFPVWAGLDHPNVAKVVDFGWEEGKAYLNTEYFEGTPILKALTGAPLPQVWRVFAQVLLALDHLYAHNVPHLDLQPNNILVAPDASGNFQVKLVDYGLMPLLYRFNPGDSNAIGTAPYTAPEYALRRSPDPRADLYSVGVLLFAVLAKRLPYEGKDSVAVLQFQLQRDAPTLKSVVGGAPPALSDFIQRLLARDPQGRFESPQQALTALQAAVGAAFPSEGLAWPAPFSDPWRVFRLQEYFKLFRRIAIQGGRWAIQSPRGGGKSFFARWLERMLWQNQKNALRLSGENLSLIQGESSLNPAFPVYLIIDDADLAPTEAWLRARPYVHVIAIGRDMAWAKPEMGWQSWGLKPLDAALTGAALESAFGKPDPRVAQALQTRFRGSPGALALGAAAMARQGMVRRDAGAWKLDGEKILRAAASPNGALLGSPLGSMPETARKALGRLAAARVPWRREDLSGETELANWLRDGWVRREIRGGEEFLRAEFQTASVAESGLSQEELLQTLEAIGSRGWADEALRSLERFFPGAAASSPRAALLRAKLLAEIGVSNEVLAILTSPFVNGLPASEKTVAFEVLGKALRLAAKDKQAEAAFRNAFQAYKAEANLAGQARVLLQTGILASLGTDLGRALQFFQQALGAAAGTPEKVELRGRIELEIAQLYVGATDFEKAETHFQEALSALEAARHGEALGEAYAVYAEYCFQTQDPERAEIFCHEALGWAAFQGSVRLQARILSTWARILKQREDMRGAGGRFGEAVELLSKSPNAEGLAQALLARADFFDSLREMAGADQDARQALEIARRLKSPRLEGEALLMTGRVQSRNLDRLDTAVNTLENARVLLSEVPNGERLWECDFSLGEIARFRGDYPAAQRYYRQAQQEIDEVLGRIGPQTQQSQDLAKRRGEMDMAMQVMG